MNAILNMLLEITLFSAVLYGAILLFQKLFRKHISAALNYAVWALLILRLIIPATVDSGFHFFIIPDESKQAAYTAASNNNALPQGYSLTNQPITDNMSSETPINNETNNTALSSQNQIKPWNLSWQTALVLIWGAGVLCSIVFLAILCRRLRQKIKHCETAVPGYVLKLVNKCKSDMGIKADICVSVQGWLKSPALSVSLRPMLLLPEHMLHTMDLGQLEFGIRHELTHYLRRDYLVNILLVAVRCVYWFNPVLYLAFRSMQTDMETACDTRITSRLNKTERMRYIRTMIDLGGSGNIQYVLGMGMSKGGKEMEKRVRGIFMRKKTKLSVRLVVVFLACVMLVACFTTACQPTLDKPVVVGKTDERLEEQTAQTTAALRKTYQVAENWQDTFSENDGKLIINVDADIEMPSVNAIPIYKVTSQSFTQAQVDKMIELLFKGTTIEVNSHQWTKYEDFIAGLKKQYATTNDTGMTPEEYDASIAELERRMQNAPDTVEKMDVSVAQQLLSETNRLDLKADMGKKQPATLTIYNGNIQGSDGGYIIAVAYRNNDGINYNSLNWDKNTIGLKITEDEAKKKAKELITSLGVDYMDIAATDIGVAYGTEGGESKGCPRCYLICFTRTVDGMPTTYDYRTGDSVYSDTYESTWAYERITIGVDDSGIVQLDWEGNASLGDLVDSDAQLLPFENIKDAFIQSMKSMYGYSGDNTAVFEFNIDRIVLGMSRVKIKDSGEYCMVPVWDFFGTRKNSPAEEGNQTFTWQAGSQSLLTINALDGSVIDRSVGY